MAANHPRILITGGGTFLGDNIAAALLAEGADVTLLVRPGAEDKLGILAQRVRWRTADVWDPASLRGLARGHSLVIHTVGSMVEDPKRGLTYHRLNFVSARNIVTMCVSDGVPHMMLLSAANAPWIKRRYIRAKREAEHYLERVGVQGTIIRAPITYRRGQSRQFFYQLMTLLGSIPVISWFGFRRIAPMPVDSVARGIARLALETDRSKMIYYAGDLRRRNHRDDVTYPLFMPDAPDPVETPLASIRRVSAFDLIDEDAPFGWTPPSDRKK